METIKITQVVEVSSPCPLLARAPCTPVHLYPALHWAQVQEKHAAVQTVFCTELPCSALQFTIEKDAVCSGGEFCSGAPAKWSCCLLKITQLRRRESWKSRPGGDAAQKQTTCCLECFTHNIVSRQNGGEVVLGHTESKSMFNFSSETSGGSGGSVQLQVVGQWDWQRKMTD